MKDILGKKPVSPAPTKKVPPVRQAPQPQKPKIEPVKPEKTPPEKQLKEDELKKILADFEEEFDVDDVVVEEIKIATNEDLVVGREEEAFQIQGMEDEFIAIRNEEFRIEREEVRVQTEEDIRKKKKGTKTNSERNNSK